MGTAWFDAENLFGALEANKRLEETSPNDKNVFVMGPWIHGGWNMQSTDGSYLGHVPFNSKTSEHYREKIELPFFEHHLKGKEGFKPAKAMMFETGTNQWRDYPIWPPRHTKPLTFYFREKGKLSHEAPAEPGDKGFDEYVSDPAKPVPYFDKVGIRMAAEYMVADQRFASHRTDVLVYETDVLEKDVSLAGPLVADLRVSTSGTDSDWIVKLIDVYPNDFPDPKPNPGDVRMGGFQQLVRGEVMRGKFRSSFEKPEAFISGQYEPLVKFTLPDVCHTFRRGHKIMVHVQSTWFPLVDRNPQTFVDIYSGLRKAISRRRSSGCIGPRNCRRGWWLKCCPDHQQSRWRKHACRDEVFAKVDTFRCIKIEHEHRSLARFGSANDPGPNPLKMASPLLPAWMKQRHDLAIDSA